jgi:hypothetical protein
VSVFLGPQSVAYTEVVSVGAPGRYRGLLAWAPDGYGGAELSFHLDSGGELALTPVDMPYDPALLAWFRSGATPNTYGEFRDDEGYVGTLVQEADDLMALLYLGTELRHLIWRAAKATRNLPRTSSGLHKRS